MTAYDPENARLQLMVDDVRSIREKTCELKNRDNPRYLALSSVVHHLNKAIASMEAKG